MQNNGHLNHYIKCSFSEIPPICQDRKKICFPVICTWITIKKNSLQIVHLIRKWICTLTRNRKHFILNVQQTACLWQLNNFDLKMCSQNNREVQELWLLISYFYKATWKIFVFINNFNTCEINMFLGAV